MRSFRHLFLVLLCPFKLLMPDDPMSCIFPAKSLPIFITKAYHCREIASDWFWYKFLTLKVAQLCALPWIFVNKIVTGTRQLTDTEVALANFVTEKWENSWNRKGNFDCQLQILFHWKRWGHTFDPDWRGISDICNKQRHSNVFTVSAKKWTH